MRGPVVHLPDARHLLPEQVPAHAHLLGALPREEQGRAGAVVLRPGQGPPGAESLPLAAEDGLQLAVGVDGGPEVRLRGKIETI